MDDGRCQFAAIVGVVLSGVSFVTSALADSEGEFADGAKHCALRSNHDDVQSSTRVARFAEGAVILMAITDKR